MLWHHNARVNSHQRLKQMPFRVCFHLWCELTITMNVTEWHVSWNSWLRFAISSLSLSVIRWLSGGYNQQKCVRTFALFLSFISLSFFFSVNEIWQYTTFCWGQLYFVIYLLQVIIPISVYVICSLWVADLEGTIQNFLLGQGGTCNFSGWGGGAVSNWVLKVGYT